MSKQKKKPERSYALIIIALCFLGSAVLRGGSVAEAAVTTFNMTRAADPAQDAKQDGMAKSMPASPKDMSGKDAMKDKKCDAGLVIDMLKAREAEFSKRELSINARAAKLDTIAARLEQRLMDLEKSRKELTKTVAIVDGAQSRDIDHLVTMYSNMKPKTAGRLFNQMDVKFASELLIRTKPELAALILANMDPDKAFTASVMIARRNAAAPNE